MRVFLTGPTGFIGSVVVHQLREQGHTLSGLAHTSQAEATLQQWGVTPVGGTLEDQATLTTAAQAADAVIHLGQLDGPGFPANDALVATTLIAALRGTGKRLLYTSGAAVPGDSGLTPRDETTPLDPAAPMAWRGVTERKVLAASADGVHACAIRPTMVYSPTRLGMASLYQGQMQHGGIARYVGDGLARWSTVHVEDLADLYVRVLETGAAGEMFIAASAEVVQFRAMAELVAGGPDKTASWPIAEARSALGLLADLMNTNAVWSGAKAQHALDWRPHGVTLLSLLHALPTNNGETNSAH